MKKYLVNVEVKDNKKFGVGVTTYKFLVLDKDYPSEAILNYLESKGITRAKILDVKMIDEKTPVDDVDEVII